jgi:uncharacterized repeat protein (TIGR01451 family)
MNTSIQHPGPNGIVQPSGDSSRSGAALSAWRNTPGRFTFAALLAGLFLLLFSAPAARAQGQPNGCAGSGLGIFLDTPSGDSHVGCTICYSITVFNGGVGGLIYCDATNITASVTTPDHVTHTINLASLTSANTGLPGRTSLSNGQFDHYTNVVCYTISAANMLPDGSVRATAQDIGIILQNDTPSASTNEQGVNTQVTQPCVQIAAQCVPSVGGPLVGGNGALSYSGTVTNCGNDVLTNVTVTSSVSGLVTIFPSLAIGQVVSFSGFWVPANPCSPSTNTFTAQASETVTNCAPVGGITSSATVICQNTLTTGLAVTKACPERPVAPGQLLTYSGSVSNTGSVMLTNTVVVNNQPAPGTVVFIVSSLQPGEVAYFNGSYLVPTNNCSMTDTLTATGQSVCGVAVTNTASATCPVTSTPGIVVTKACPTQPVAPGQLLTYSGSVSNTGSVTLTNTVVVNNQPAPGTVVFIVSSLRPGEVAYFNGSYLVPTNICSVTDTLTVTGQSICGVTVTNTASATCPVTSTPGIVVTKACPTQPVAPGQLFAFSGSVSNTGSVTLTNIVVVNNQPAANTVVFTVASLAPGAVTTFTGSYLMPTNNCALTDTLTATAASLCGVGVSSVASATCPVITTPGIVVTKACPTQPVAPGQLFAFSGSVRNTGNVTLTNIVVVNNQPAAGTVVLTVASLDPGAVTNFTGSYVAPNNCSVTDTLTVTGRSVCGVAVTNTASATCPVTSTPGIVVTKACPTQPVAPGQLLTYSGSVSNTGSVTLTNTVVVNNQPAPGTVVFIVSSLRPGEVAYFNGSYLVPTNICSVTDTLTVTGQSICGVTVTNTASATCPVTTTPAIVVTTSCPITPVGQGGILTYSGTVSNAGNITLTNIIVVNNWPYSSVIFTATSLAPGATTNFTASYVVPGNCCVALMWVVASGQGCNGVTVTGTGSGTCTVLTSPSIVVTKVCVPTMKWGRPVLLRPGDLLTYSGTVCNNGNTTLYNVTVVDNQPVNNTLIIGPIALAPGECQSYTGSYTVPPDFCGGDTVTASGLDLCLGTPVTNSVTATCPVAPYSPRIVVTKRCPEQPSQHGGQVIYSGTVSNAGNVTLINVFVVDNQPSNNAPVIGPIILAPGAVWNFTGRYTAPPVCCTTTDTLTASGQDRCSGSNVTATATAICPMLYTPGIALVQTCPPNLTNGGVYNFSGFVTNTGDAILTNVLVFSSQAGQNLPLLGPLDLVPGQRQQYSGSVVPSNTCAVTITVTSQETCKGTWITNTTSCPVLSTPQITVTLACPAVPPANGGLITYTGTVSNPGNVTLNNVTVVNSQSGTVLTVPSLAPGASTNFTASFTTSIDACSVSSTVIATGSDNCTHMVTNTASATCLGINTAGIKVTKVCPAQPVSPGQLLTFSGSVSNTGNVTLTNIIVWNNRPAANTLVFIVASLAPGAVTNFTGSYVAPTNCSVTDTLTATAASRCGGPITNTASATCPLLTIPAITITESCPTGQVTAGSSVVFGGSVCNSGNITLTNIFVFSSSGNNTLVLGPLTLLPGACAQFTGSYLATGGSNPTTNLAGVVLFTPTNTVTAFGWSICPNVDGLNAGVSAAANCLGPVARAVVPAPLVPVIGKTTVANGIFSLSFPTGTGISYTVQYQNTFTDPWTDLPGMPVLGTGGDLTITDPTAAGQPSRFYRVVVTP